MKTISEFLQLITPLSTKDIRCIYKTTQPLSEKDIRDLLSNNCAIETANFNDVLSAFTAGFSKERIYFDVTNDSQHHLRKIIGKCRLIAHSLEVLNTIDQEIQKTAEINPIECIAIRVVPEDAAFNITKGIFLQQISALSTRLKRLDHLSIRGIFVNQSFTPDTPVSKLKDSFSTVKNIRSWLPCTFSYFCLENVTSELLDSTFSSISDSLDIICLLNNTSLYSEFLIS